MFLQCTTDGMRQSWNDGSLTMVGKTHTTLSVLVRLRLTRKPIDIPYPSPADRRDLENLVKTNWGDKVQRPLGQVSEQASDQFHHAKEWVFDT